jgi:hypothetical protein
MTRVNHPQPLDDDAESLVDTGAASSQSDAGVAADARTSERAAERDENAATRPKVRGRPFAAGNPGRPKGTKAESRRQKTLRWLEQTANDPRAPQKERMWAAQLLLSGTRTEPEPPAERQQIVIQRVMLPDPQPCGLCHANSCGLCVALAVVSEEDRAAVRRILSADRSMGGAMDEQVAKAVERLAGTAATPAPQPPTDDDREMTDDEIREERRSCLAFLRDTEEWKTEDEKENA